MLLYLMLRCTTNKYMTNHDISNVKVFNACTSKPFPHHRIYEDYFYKQILMHDINQTMHKNNIGETNVMITKTIRTIFLCTLPNYPLQY